MKNIALQEKKRNMGVLKGRSPFRKKKHAVGFYEKHGPLEKRETWGGG